MTNYLITLIVVCSLIATGLFLKVRQEQTNSSRYQQICEFNDALHSPEKGRYYRIVNHPVNVGGGRASLFFFTTDISFEGLTLVDLNIMRHLRVPSEYRIYPDLNNEPAGSISNITGPEMPKYLTIVTLKGVDTTVFLKSEQDVLKLQLEKN